MNRMEILQYKRAILLARSLTVYFNKFHYSYSGAGWEAHEVFRIKKLLMFGIYPEVSGSILDDKSLVVNVCCYYQW